MKAVLRCLLLLSGLGLAGSAAALSPGDRVDNFRLLDQNGASHELYYLSDAKAVVLMVHGNGCPIVRQALPALQELRDQYRGQGVEFLLINSNLQDDREAIAAEAAEFGIDIPILIDETQLIGEVARRRRARPRSSSIDPKTWKLVYRGPLDDRLAYGAQKPAATKHYLADALDAMLAGKAGRRRAKRRRPAAWSISRSATGATEHAAISYSETHRPAARRELRGLPPAGRRRALGHDQLRDGARLRADDPRSGPHQAHAAVACRSALRQLRRRPVAHDDEARTLVHWIEAGAPRGTGPDPLAGAGQRPGPSGRWAQPDLIVEVPAFEVPATGVVDYQYPRAANPLGRDVWVRAVEILPGDRAVVHHVLAGIDDPANGPSARSRARSRSSAATRRARTRCFYPEDTGVLLRKEAGFRFQMHYTPNGKATTDVTRVGYYFAEQAPKHPLHLTMLMDTGSLAIPPHAKAHTETLEHVFDRDVMLYSLMPHAHLRGQAAQVHRPLSRRPRRKSCCRCRSTTSAGRRPTSLTAPKAAARRHELVFDMTWDNSAQNPANPDPARSSTGATRPGKK